ncbi:hypothetical protein [Kitasatospora sp. NPDC088134]|uniref:terpene synthase family protein n=1 Tax=Kitasatospora sp. NPDC088134 TaxID=3364071 RepID=UPI003813050E
MKTTVDPRLPALWCPIPVRTHPQSALIEERTNRWLLDHRIVARDEAHRERLTSYGLGWIASMFFPHADLERAQLGADLICAWGFPVDDLIDDVRQDSDRLVLRLNNLLRLLDAPSCPPVDDDPLAAAWVEARTRLLRFATPAQIARHTESWRLWFFGGTCERAQRSLGGVPDLNETVAVKLYGVGAAVPMTYCEIAGDYRLDADELALPAVRALGEMMWILCNWDNDIFSLPRDLTNGIGESNLITILARRDGTGVPEAVATALAMRNQVMALFLRLREQVLPQVSEPMRLYLRDVGLHIAAYTEFWHHSCREKLEVDPAHAGLLPEIAVDTAPDAVVLGGPLPVPAIAWWWECLDAPLTAGPRG